MKKTLISIFVLFLVFSTSCIKRNNCDCGLTGELVWFEEGVQYGAASKKVNAEFTADDTGFKYLICDKIPKKYQVTNASKVNICIKEGEKGVVLLDHPPLYKLTCIEKTE